MKSADVNVTAPCGNDWRTMTPRAGGRFCGDCNKVVRNLSEMTEEEAKALLAARPADLCVRYIHDREGRVFFARAVAHADAANGLVPASLLNRAKRVAAAVATVALPFGAEACSSGDTHLGASPLNHEVNEDPSAPKYYENMGGAPDNPQYDLPQAAGDAGDGGDAGKADAH